jgi:hypothetical protein
MSGAIERGHAQIFKQHQQNREPSLVGSPGLNNRSEFTADYPAEGSIEQTGAAKDLKIARVAKEAGRHTMPHAVLSPTQVPPADYIG